MDRVLNVSNVSSLYVQYSDRGSEDFKEVGNFIIILLMAVKRVFGQVERIGKLRHAYKISVGKTRGNRGLEKLKYR